MNVFELFGRVSLTGMDKVDGQLSKLEKNTQKVQKGLRIMGAAFTAVGAAGLALATTSRKLNAQLSVTAINLGITTKEMRDLTLETTNVTFPLGEVADTFDLLARAGIRDIEVIKNTATAFDTLGDATGYGASQVTGVMVPAMKTFGLSADEISAKTDMMTYMIRNSTVSLEDFNTMVGYTDQEMVAAGFTVDDMAAAMIWMSDNGVAPGRVMLREWNKAVTKSKDENIAMTEALGMTSGELETYKDKLAGATGITEEFSDAANKQYGIMDKLKQKWSEMTLQYGTFLQPLEPILATMTALGPVLMLFSTVLIPKLTFATARAAIATVAVAAATKVWNAAKIVGAAVTKAATIAQWAFNVALTANPIGLIVMAVAALIAGIVALMLNLDKVTGWLKGVFGQRLEDVRKYTEEELQIRADALDEQRDQAKEAYDEQRGDAQKSHDQKIEDIRDFYGVLEGYGEEDTRTLMDKAREDTEIRKDALNEQIQDAKDVHQQALGLIQEEYDAKLKLLDDEAAWDLAVLQNQLNSIDEAQAAEAEAKKAQENREREAYLRSAVATADTVEDKEAAEEELADFLADIDEDKRRKAFQNQKDALREQMAAVRADARERKEALQRELESEREAEKLALEQKLTGIQTEQDSLDIALENQLVRLEKERIKKEEESQVMLDNTVARIDAEEKAFNESLDREMEEVIQFVQDYNYELDQLRDKTVNVNIVTNQIGGGNGGAGGEGHSGSPNPGDVSAPGGGWVPGGSAIPGGLPGLDTGGLINYPTWLTRVGSTTPYAKMSEKGPELISNPSRQTADIRIYLDGKVLAEKLGTPLVTSIRVKAGVR